MVPSYFKCVDKCIDINYNDGSLCRMKTSSYCYECDNCYCQSHIDNCEFCNIKICYLCFKDHNWSWHRKRRFFVYYPPDEPVNKSFN